MLSSSIFGASLKECLLKFLYNLYIFSFGGSLKVPDFIVVDTAILWSERPVSKLSDKSKIFFLLEYGQY